MNAVSSPAVERAARGLMRHRGVALGAVLVLTAVLGWQAAKVRPDYSVEQLFPVWDPARQAYDRFKAAFPHEDTRAIVMVSGTEVLGRESLARIAALEADLAKVDGVEEVLGPTTARTLVPDGAGVALEPLLPSADVTDRRLAYATAVLTADPLFAWNLVKPDGSAATVIVRLDPVRAGSDQGRQQLAKALRAVVARHEHPGQELILSGVPIIRAMFASMVLDDVNTFVPLALVLVLVLLFVVFRSPAVVLASLATVLVSLVAAYAVMGALGYSLTYLLSVLPVIAIIISVSDSVHIGSHFLDARRAGQEPRTAVVTALGQVALPCLMTEVVIGGGFLSLVAVNITAILQFGVAAALTMLLVWVANVTVLPLALSFARGQVAPAAVPVRQPALIVRGVHRFAGWISGVVDRHPRRIVVVFVLVLGAAIAAGSQVSTTSYVLVDDLRPGSRELYEIRRAEEVHGGLLPLALFIEPAQAGPGAALDPELVRIADRGAAMLRALPEVAQANSLGDYLRHAGSALGIGDPLDPDNALTREQLERALAKLPAGSTLLQDVLSRDRGTLAVQGRVLDCGTQCINGVFEKVEAWIAEENARLAGRGAPVAAIHATSQARIFKSVNDLLMRGLVGSFGASLLLSLVMASVLLRSWRLGVVALVPNVTPIVLVLGLMALLGVALKPVTVVLFSVTLVIAEDDTLQLLSRLRGHYRLAKAHAAPGEDPHRRAALACMREVSVPILVTSAAVSGGFLLLLLSSFLGPANLGLLIGATLFAAVFADLFLTPLLIIWLRPFAERGQPDTLAAEAR